MILSESIKQSLVLYMMIFYILVEVQSDIEILSLVNVTIYSLFLQTSDDDLRSNEIDRQ